ncbi:ras-related protein Rab-8A, partial [Caerostris extrusa]
DTAGQERFRTLTTAYYRGAMVISSNEGILVMYDVTNMDSFNHLTYWFRNVEENASQDVVKVLVGNKCDASHMRVIDFEKAKRLPSSMKWKDFSGRKLILISKQLTTGAYRCGC